MAAVCLFSALLCVGCAATSSSRASVAPTGIAWLIFIDDLHFDFRNTGRVRLLLRSISTELIRDDDVFAMRSSGPTAVAFAASSDRAQLDAAIRTVTGGALRPAEIRNEALSTRNEVGLRLDMAFDAASELIVSVPASKNRRRIMLYVSNGYDFAAGSARAADFSAAARRANVLVFAMNASGLPGSQAASGSIDAESWKDIVTARRQSLRAISEPTGGFALLEDTDYADAMARIRGALK
jgi:hypothetical protein